MVVIESIIQIPCKLIINENDPSVKIIVDERFLKEKIEINWTD